jgi:nitrile hydratase
MAGVDGVHDLGGLTGFGPVERESNEPVFHHTWESRVFGCAAALSVAGHVTGLRHAIERMDAVHYLTSSYYEHWMTAVATALVERGTIDVGELSVRAGSFPLARPVAGDPVPLELAGPPAAAPKYGLGSEVRVRNLHPLGHTRCPDYVRDRRGVVVRVDPLAAVPELEHHLDERVLETVYSVEFRVEELWGTGDPRSTVSVDLFERYLEDVA